MRTQDTSRGSALILAVIAVLVVTTIGIAMVRMTYREVAGSLAGAHQQALIACAEAARVQLVSQMHLIGFQGQLPALNTTKLGTVTGNTTTYAVGGHYDTPTSGVVVEQVTPLPPKASGPAQTTPDISNVLTLMGTPGNPMKVVALCKDGTGGGRQLEVEFGLEFGL